MDETHAVELAEEERLAHERRAKRGAWLIAIGILGILWGVFHLLGAVGGPEARDFAHRQTYDQVKPLVQGAFLGALVRALAGLAVAVLGGKMRAGALRALGRGD